MRKFEDRAEQVPHHLWWISAGWPTIHGGFRRVPHPSGWVYFVVGTLGTPSSLGGFRHTAKLTANDRRSPQNHRERTGEKCQERQDNWLCNNEIARYEEPQSAVQPWFTGPHSRKTEYTTRRNNCHSPLRSWDRVSERRVRGLLILHVNLQKRTQEIVVRQQGCRNGGGGETGYARDRERKSAHSAKAAAAFRLTARRSRGTR